MEGVITFYWDLVWVIWEPQKCFNNYLTEKGIQSKFIFTPGGLYS